MKFFRFFLCFAPFFCVQNLINPTYIGGGGEQSRAIYGGQFIDKHNIEHFKVVTQNWSDKEKFQNYSALSFECKLILITKSANMCLLVGLMLCFIAVGIFDLVFFTAQAVGIIYKIIYPSQFLNSQLRSQSSSLLEILEMLSFFPTQKVSKVSEIQSNEKACICCSGRASSKVLKPHCKHIQSNKERVCHKNLVSSWNNCLKM